MSSIQRAMERQRARRGQSPVPAGDEAQGGEHAGEEAVAPAETEPRAPAPVSPDVELNLDYLRGRGMLTPGADRRDLQEQYRLVKRRVITQAFEGPTDAPNPGNLLQITSSLLDEGKTFTAFNLGMSISMEVDFTVLLVDADLTRRSLTNMIGLGDRPGLTEVLTGETSNVADIVYRTSVPRLSVIPAGGDHPRATELIASADMRRLTRELASRYSDRLVIFDSTPLLMDSQAATLALHMGQLLLVVEAGRTQEQAVREAVGLLESSSAAVGLLLNKGGRSHGYGYYGGY